MQLDFAEDDPRPPDVRLTEWRGLRHDERLREVAHVIYDTVYPASEWTDLSFQEAERFTTPHYRNAVDAAHKADNVLTTDVDRQLAMPL